MSKLTSVIASFAALFPALVAQAQDFQTGAVSDGQERSAGVNDSTESLNTGRGGFLGIGGQKPLQRVKGIPLPTRQNRYAANSFSGQAGGSFDSAPLMQSRRTKPMSGELTTDFPARMIYLNGKNVSSVREQTLENVNVRIDAQGNVYISAPHYEVQESTHYRPLLPNEVPKVGKPSPSSDSPLMQGRHSKSAPSQRSVVPPVETEDADSVEQGPALKPAEPAKNQSKDSPAGSDAAKTPTKGI